MGISASCRAVDVERFLRYIAVVTQIDIETTPAITPDTKTPSPA